MRGRHLKVYIAGEEPILTTLKLAKKVREMIPESVNFSKEITDYIIAKYGNKESAELEELKKHKVALERDLAITTLEIQKIENKIAEQKALEQTIEENKHFAVYIIRYFIKQARGYGYARRYLVPSTTFYNMGVELDYNKLYNDLDKSIIDNLTDDEFLEHYHVRYTANNNSELKYLRDKLFAEFSNQRSNGQRGYINGHT